MLKYSFLILEKYQFLNLDNLFNFSGIVLRVEFESGIVLIPGNIGG